MSENITLLENKYLQRVYETGRLFAKAYYEKMLIDNVKFNDVKVDSLIVIFDKTILNMRMLGFYTFLDSDKNPNYRIAASDCFDIDVENNTIESILEFGEHCKVILQDKLRAIFVECQDLESQNLI